MTIQELGKEHMIQKNTNNAEKYTTKFLQELDEVETELNRQINYLGQVFMVFLSLYCILRVLFDLHVMKLSTCNRMNSDTYQYFFVTLYDYIFSLGYV